MFSKTVNINGVEIAFKFLDDETQQGRISSNEFEHFIDFEIFATEEDRIKIMNALASENFVRIERVKALVGDYYDHVQKSDNSIGKLTGQIAARSAVSSNIISYNFSYETQMFMEFLIEQGLPEDFSATTALLTDLTGAVTAEERIESFNEFRKSYRALKVSHTGSVSGISTFVSFYIAEHASNRSLALALANKANDEPYAILELLWVTASYFKENQLEALSDEQLNVLISFTPANKRSQNHNYSRSFESIADLIMKIENWSEVRLKLKENDWDSKELNLALEQTFDTAILDGAERKVQSTVNLEFLVAMVRSFYGDDAVERTYRKLSSAEELIKTQAEFFEVFLNTADFFKDGGDEETAISWLVALTPNVDSADVISTGATDF